jgi:hypothetical protein
MPLRNVALQAAGTVALVPASGTRWQAPRCTRPRRTCEPTAISETRSLSAGPLPLCPACCRRAPWVGQTMCSSVWRCSRHWLPLSFSGAASRDRCFAAPGRCSPEPGKPPPGRLGSGSPRARPRRCPGRRASRAPGPACLLSASHRRTTPRVLATLRAQCLVTRLHRTRRISPSVTIFAVIGAEIVKAASARPKLCP